MPEAARLTASELARSQCTFVPPGNSCARTGGSNRNCVVIIAKAEATFSIDSALICKTSSFRFAHLGVSEEGKTRTFDPDPTRMRSMTLPNRPTAVTDLTKTVRVNEHKCDHCIRLWSRLSYFFPRLKRSFQLTQERFASAPTRRVVHVWRFNRDDSLSNRAITGSSTLILAQSLVGAFSLFTVLTNPDPARRLAKVIKAFASGRDFPASGCEKSITVGASVLLLLLLLLLMLRIVLRFVMLVIRRHIR